MIHIESGALAAGEITSLDTVRLDGKLEGRITCPRLEIGPHGYLLGDAEVEEIAVEGQVVGTIRARSVTLAATALVEGDVHHQLLALAPSAVLVGSSVRVASAEPPAAVTELRARRKAAEAEIDDTERESRERQRRSARGGVPAYDELRARMFA